MSAPTVVSSASTTAASATTITVTAPTSITKGNMLIAVIGVSSSSSAMVGPSGWSQLSAPIAGCVSWCKVATDVEPANYAWTWTTAGVSCGIIVNVTGNSSSALPDAFGAQANVSSGNIVAPAVTPLWNADLLLSVYVDIGANTITVPGGQSNTGGTTGNSRAIICGYETLSSNSSTGTRTATATAAVNYGFNIVVREPTASSKTFLPVQNPPNFLYSHPGMVSGRGPVATFAQSGYHVGAYRVAGTCKVNGTLTSGQRVSLYRFGDDRALLSMITGADGAFSFNYLPAGRYRVVDGDTTGADNALIYDYVDAAAM